jgi:drug/metabolite transporter (DMT)-like permease
VSTNAALLERRPRVRIGPRAAGIAFALATALISGVSIYVNGYAVKHFADASVYTTAKNAVAGVLLLLMWRAARRPDERCAPAEPFGRRAAALLTVAVVGGSVPFVLFFEGLARAQATQASFFQKTLVVWVALLAVPLLRERLRLPHALAIALIMAGQVWLAGSLGTVAFGTGETMILIATLLWAAEVVYVRHLLRSFRFGPGPLAAARLGLGTLLLLGWLAITGKLEGFASFGTTQWGWVLLTGALLTGYVATWYRALARAQALDVTAVLVLGAPVTALLSGAVDGTTISLAGTLLVTAGVAVIAWASLRQRPRPAPAT